MDFNYDNNFGNDALRQECVELLKNYVPVKNQKFQKIPVNFSNSLTAVHTFSQAKADFRAKNENYVQGVRDVMRLNREAAKQRNVQVFKGFLHDLTSKPIKEEIADEPTESSPKRKLPKVRIAKRRKIKQEFSSPDLQQSAFCPPIQQPELSHQFYDPNNEALKYLDFSAQQVNFYQMPFHQPTNFYFPYQRPVTFTSDYYQPDLNAVYTYQS